MQMQRRGVEMRLVIADTNASHKVDPVLARSVARAYGWWEQLLTSKVNTMLEIAAHEKVNPSYIGDVTKLAFLSPEIVESILAGKHPAHLTSVKLIRRTTLPLDWTEQKQLLKM